MIKVRKDPTKLHTPGALEVKQTHTFKIISGYSSKISDLENGTFQFKHAKEMIDFLIANVPCGVYRKFVLLVLKNDICCNNYIADKLKIDRKEMRIKFHGSLHE